MRDRYRRSFILSNYTPSGWWECDVFEISASGFFREFEIKLNRSDFKSDATKRKRRYDWKDGTNEDLMKHELLARRDPRGPTRFYYVCPEGVLTPEIVPEWAGLLITRMDRAKVYILEAKSAPQLHRQKVSSKVQQHASGICYWRMHHLQLRRQPS